MAAGVLRWEKRFFASLRMTDAAKLRDEGRVRTTGEGDEMKIEVA